MIEKTEIQSVQAIQLLNEIAKEILWKHSIDEIVKTVYESINKLMDATIFIIGVYDDGSKRLDFWGINDKSESVRIGHQSIKNKDVWAVHCFLTQKEILINDYSSEKYDKYFSFVLFKRRKIERKSFIYLPITYREKKIGILCVQSFDKDTYKEIHLDILNNLANYIAIAIDNASAYEKIAHQNSELKFNAEKLEYAHQNLEKMVHERTRELEEANRKLEKLSIVARETDNAIMIMDAEGNIKWINDCFTRIYGYNYEEFVAARGKNIRQTSFNPRIEEYIQKCISKKKSVRYTALNIMLSGKEIWTQTTLTPILGEDGSIKNLVTIDSDISKIKAAESKALEAHKNMMDSIQYASRIQEAMLPPKELLDELLSEYFILNMPRDVISGDFYWVKKVPVKKGENREVVIVAVADCTGHGVPGAFMSMLGITLLNEIVKSPTNNELQAADILNALRTKVKKSLRQTGKQGEPKDGMDISLVIIDKENKRIQYAGANNSALIYPKIARNDEAYILFKPNKMPIGIHINEEESFTNQEYFYQKGDNLYLYSDGYVDQFGGTCERKFLACRFRELLTSIQSMSLDEQVKHLETTSLEWRGKLMQIDDIMVVGIRLD